MRESHKPFIAIACQTTLVNKTGTWRTQRPEYEAGISPCQSACPARNYIPKCLDLVEQGELRNAWEVIMETNPLPFVCGSVCPHLCEASCNREQFDEALAIRDMERFLGEEALKNNWLPPKVADSNEAKVAIIGSGPAGLSCAYQLARRGYKVTIYEALPVVGGMLQVGIQDYRLPRDILQREISNNILLPFKVEVKANSPVSREVFQRIRQEFQAIFIATGAQKARELNVPGVNLDGGFYGVSFLRDRALSKLPPDLLKGKKVVVVGGGGVAIDASRTAVRLGAEKVQLVCLESQEDMPAYEWDIQDAAKEGVELNCSWGPEEILGDDNGKVRAVSFIRCTSVFDSEGKFNPSFDRSIERSFEADAAIIAIGQVSDLSFLAEEVRSTPEGKVKVDDALKTDVAGIFAGGDTVTQPATVIEAIAAGSRAAHSINRYLRGEPLTLQEEGGRIVQFEELNLDYFEHQVRQARISEPLSAVEEARRCFSCGYCNMCGMCWVFCPDIAIRQEEDHYEIDYDYCKGCGICVQECPSSSIVLVKE